MGKGTAKESNNALMQAKGEASRQSEVNKKKAATRQVRMTFRIDGQTAGTH